MDFPQCSHLGTWFEAHCKRKCAQPWDRERMRNALLSEVVPGPLPEDRVEACLATLEVWKACYLQKLEAESKRDATKEYKAHQGWVNTHKKLGEQRFSLLQKISGSTGGGEVEDRTRLASLNAEIQEAKAHVKNSPTCVQTANDAEKRCSYAREIYECVRKSLDFSDTMAVENGREEWQKREDANRKRRKIQS